MIRLTCRLTLALLAAGFLTESATFGQQVYQTPSIQGVPTLLQRLDPMRQDMGPLADSLRAVNMQADLRAPIGFTNVYRVPGRDDLYMRASGAMYAIFPQSVYLPSEQGPVAAVPPGTIFSIGLPSLAAMPSAWTRAPALVWLDQQGTGGAARGVNDLPIAAPTERMPMAGNLPVIARVDARRNTQVSDIQWTETGDAPLEGALDQQAARHAIDARRPGARTEPPEPARLLKTLVNDDQLRAERLAELLRQAAEAARGGG